MRLSPMVRCALVGAMVDGNRLRLTGQLDRKDYLEVNKALEAMGGKWSKKERVHLFEDDAEQVVADAIATGAVVDFKKAFQFFETPREIADLLVYKADIREHQEVLEPSAGRGCILEAIRRIAGVEPSVCELWEPNRVHLANMRARLIGWDFLELDCDPFDRIVANPPFTRQQDIDHVLHMWSLLKPGGRLVSVMSPGWTFRSDRKSKALRSLIEGHGGEWAPLPENAFSESGTGVNSGFLVLDKPEG